jgi:two-component system sensor histidine kinase PilS (NtrC family)
VVVATILLVLVVATGDVRGPLFALGPVLGVVGAAYLLSFGSYVALRRGRAPRGLAVAQVGADLLLATLLVHVTGGAFSVFTFVYLLSVMAASRVLAPWRSLQTAAAVVLLHGGLLALRLYGMLPALGQGPAGRDVHFEASLSLLVVLGNMCAAFIVAYVSARMAERLRQGEQDLSDLKVLHEDIVESVASGLLTLDDGGRVTTANRMAGAIAGVAPGALVGRRWSQAFGQVPPFAQLLGELAEGRHVRRLEGEMVRPGGTVVPVGLSLARLSRGDAAPDAAPDAAGPGGPTGVVCSFQDLTQIRKMEAQVRRADRLAAVGALAASLAHEIRNPLMAVAGSIEELGRSLQPAGTDRRLMDIALAESGRLNTLLSEFLEYSRVRPVQRQPTEVEGLLAGVAHLLTYDPRTPPSVKVTLAVTPPGLRASVDAKQLHQALLNLCLNAVEAMPDGGELAVAARLLAGPGAGRTLEVRVRDTGPGIPDEERARVFEPFYSTKARGFGLGLAVVHRIVQDHGGQIDLEREEGWGTTFVLTLPLGEGEGA